MGIEELKNNLEQSRSYFGGEGTGTGGGGKILKPLK